MWTTEKKSCSLNYLFFSFFFSRIFQANEGGREIVTDATVINRGSSIYYLSPVFSYQYQRPLLVVVFGKEKGKGGIRSHGTNRTWTSWQRKKNKKKNLELFICIAFVEFRLSSFRQHTGFATPRWAANSRRIDFGNNFFLRFFFVVPFFPLTCSLHRKLVTPSVNVS